MSDSAALALAVALEMMAPAEKSPGRVRTFRHDNPHLEHAKEDRPAARALSGNNRQSGGSNARFKNAPVTEPSSIASASIRANHPALRDGTTIYPSRLFDAGDRDHVLIDGFNNAKLGRWVTKGPWRGCRIYTLTLEERATCPRSCAVWAQCYGNNLPVAVRFKYDMALIERLEIELAALNAKGGFVVRLHALGDFVNLGYTRQWATWLKRYPNLHVYGYTAHPSDSEIGRLIGTLNANPRWKVRFSVALETTRTPMQAAVVWTRDDMAQPGGLVCPQELGKTATCGSCALCWAEPMADTRILFLGHGGNRGRHPKETS